MADGNFGERIIEIDLTVTGARVIRDATLGMHVKLNKIVLEGVGHATLAAPIVLRKESASGPVVWANPGTATVEYNIDAPFTSPAAIMKGLYMDTQTNAWVSGRLLIYTA
jgi:hypothetical protein